MRDSGTQGLRGRALEGRTERSVPAPGRYSTVLYCSVLYHHGAGVGPEGRTERSEQKDNGRSEHASGRPSPCSLPTSPDTPYGLLPLAARSTDRKDQTPAAGRSGRARSPTRRC